MRLLVTGGTGFIGSHLAEAGRRRGARSGRARPGRPARGAGQRRAAAPAGRRDPAGSITDAELCARAMRGATHVFHLAVAMREGGEERRVLRVDQSRRHPPPARGGRRRGVERFVYCSTIGIYGHRAPGITPRGSPLAPGNIYERTKVAAERLVRRVRGGGGLPCSHPAAGRRVRPAGPAAAQAVQGREPGAVPAVRRRRWTAPHGVRGRRRLGVLRGLRATRRSAKG